MTNSIVFAGPSIFGLDRALLHGLELRPPASCGDILRAANQGAKAIALIDGVFENDLAIWHKEILSALSKGISVFGSSSMGALRAVECSPFGMVGVGEIFTQYQRGDRQSDADVAVLHAPSVFAFQPLTVALVDAEATLAGLRERGALPPPLCDRLLHAARGLHFTGRVWDEVVRAAQLADAEAAAAGVALEKYERSLKREDAQLLLSVLRGFSRDASYCASRLWRLSHTVYLAALEERIAGARLAVGAP